MKKLSTILGIFLILTLFLTTIVLAAEGDASAAPVEPPKIDTGDTTFVLISAALVMLMTPGLALFYGGMVRTKNVLSIIMQSFICLGVISIQWVLWGYSLAFGPDINHLLGSLDWIGLSGVGTDPNPDYAATIPQLAFMMFQGVFAIITPAIISGSVAGRVKFPAFVAFVLLWATLVYDPVAHWVWGVGGWLREYGVLDFAGGTVVHIISGVSGLVFALMVGKRKGYGSEVMAPHHLPMTVLGAALLWFGWFGFNAGSALGASGLAAVAFVTTHVAAAAATVSWIVAEWLYHGKPTLLGAASGCIAGLVAITPAAGFVTVPSAIIMGLGGGVICFFAVAIAKNKLGYDDSLDAFGVHGVGGTFGAIATGFFATTAVNPAGADGLFYGNAAQVLKQLAGVGTSWIFAAVMTFLIVKAIGLVMQIKADDEQQIQGMDITEHGERGYAYQDLMTGSPLNIPVTSISSNQVTVKETTLA
ncbi:ammonium transporter [Sporomusa sp. KB1]|jgi:Amt family ammonium transporter|uniref:ammonium transporter n=1 Tax=Sporomusa sp. KB1 TaxID=943346 RepID=UPI0011A643F1|nr:ammonium transporter [Sporomusa sp. KB1]TWH46801.1 Amt family ammonium transporter [Sporomusa sp. KB1]